MVAFASSGGEAIGRREAVRGLPAITLAQPAPDFAFDLGTGPQRLRDLIGRPVVLSFWATWCRPCLDELPLFVRARQTYGEKITLLTISSEGHDVARGYLASQNVALPLIEDSERRIFGAYSVDDIPVTIVLDGTGRTRYVSIGEVGWNELANAIDTALGENATPKNDSAAAKTDTAPTPSETSPAVRRLPDRRGLRLTPIAGFATVGANAGTQ